jgi:hypothetical protein
MSPPLNTHAAAQLHAPHKPASGQTFGLWPVARQHRHRTPAWLKPTRAALLTLLSLPAGVAATPLPWSSTQSMYTLEIGLISGTGGGEWPSEAMSSGAADAIVRAASNAIAVTFSTAPSREPVGGRRQGELSGQPGGHFATAEAQVVVHPNAPSTPNHADARTLASITASHATHAESIFFGPVFARSGAATSAVWTTEIAAAGAPATQSSGSAGGDALDLRWAFDEIALATHSFNALAGMRHVVSVIQRTDTNYRADTLGFALQVLNGVPSGQAWATVPSSVTGWLDALDRVGPGVGQTTAGTGPWASLPLLPHDAAAGALHISIELNHAEFSLEAPPAAARQVGAAAGIRSARPTLSSPSLHWDAATGLLRFEPISIADLTGSGPRPPSRNDAALGGSIQIDPLLYLGELAGLRYFAGQQFRLLDRDGTVLLLGSMPTLVFDPAIADLEGFNFFAPVMTVVAADLTRSAWLAEFLVDVDFTGWRMPTLFIGMQSDAEPDWSRSFSQPAIGLLSFSGAPLPAGAGVAVSAPNALVLVVLGLIYLGAVKRRPGIAPASIA